MKASELRIGNRVLTHRGGERIIDYLDIRDIAEGRLMFPFQPIPLTEEWLVKFGFVKEKWADYCVYCDRPTDGIQFMLIGIVPQEQNMVNINGKWIKSGTIQYVHQLQNLYFALTGEEL